MADERRVALIANTSFFVGPPLARILAGRGHDLVVGDPEDGLVADLEARGAAVEVVKGVGRGDGNPFGEIVDAGLKRFGRIDAASMFSGRVVTGRFLDAPIEDLHEVMQGCIEMPYHFLKAVAPSMVERESGQILVLTSAAGARPTNNAPLYSAARAGANMLIKNVALEVARHGVQVNAVGTNFMDFPEFLRASGGNDPAVRTKIMGGITPKPELGTVVSNAGGLGCIEGVMPPDGLRDAIHRFRELSDKPFSINFPLAMGSPEMTTEKAKVCVEEKVPVVITSAGNPKMLTAQLKEGGITVGHVVASTYHARKAAGAGVDCLIAEPTESGGYRGEQEIAMMVLIPSVRRALPDIPLVACGTVADRAGIVAVMALGADGVQLGTRLMVTKEAAASYGDHVAKLVLAADDTSTMSAEGRIRPRISKPDFAEEVLGTSSKRTQMGQVAALIDEVVSVEDVFRELFEGGPEHARAVTAKFDEIAQTAPVS